MFAGRVDFLLFSPSIIPYSLSLSVSFHYSSARPSTTYSFFPSQYTYIFPFLFSSPFTRYLISSLSFYRTFFFTISPPLSTLFVLSLFLPRFFTLHFLNFPTSPCFHLLLFPPRFNSSSPRRFIFRSSASTFFFHREIIRSRQEIATNLHTELLYPPPKSFNNPSDRFFRIPLVVSLRYSNPSHPYYSTVDSSLYPHFSTSYEREWKGMMMRGEAGGRRRALDDGKNAR